MNNLRRFEPNLLPVSEFFSRLEDGFWPFDSQSGFTVGRGWGKDALNLRVAMPAIGEKDFSLQVQGNRLMLRGERIAPRDFGEEGAVSFGLQYGHFERTIELPDGVDTAKMKAQLHHGVLDIHIPYLAEAKVRAVPVDFGKELAGAAIA